jgi:HK97 family phage major capsid protein
MTLAQIRAALAEKIKGLPALRDKALADEATQADTDALKAAMDEIKALEAKIATAVEVDEAIKRAAAPVDDTETRTPAAAKKDLTPVQKMGLAVTSIIAAHHAKSTPQAELEKHGFGGMVKELVSTTPADGGYAVPTPLSNEIIEILREDSAFLAGGPRRVGLPNGNLTIPAGDTGVTGGYGAEASNITVEQQTFRDVTLAAKRLSVLVPASNELLAWSVGDMESFIQDDMRGALGELMDLNLLRGTGASNTPVGITKVPGIPSFAAITVGTTLIDKIEATLARAETEMRNRKVMGRRAAWIMAPRTRIFLSGLRDGNGNRVYPELSYGPDANGPMLRGKRVLETTMWPINLGTAGDESEIALVDFSHVLFGEASGLSFKVSDEASYNVSGTMYSAFQRNVTLVRAITHHDTDIRHLGAVVKVTGVDWGAY